MPGYYVGDKNLRGLNYPTGVETNEEVPFRRAIHWIGIPESSNQPRFNFVEYPNHYS